MKHDVLTALITVALLTVVSCGSGEKESSCSGTVTVKDITVDRTRYDMISEDGVTYYSFTVDHAGNYSISLSDISQACTWALYPYIDTCIDYYGAGFEITGTNTATLDDVFTTRELNEGRYIVAVRESNPSGTATYRLGVLDKDGFPDTCGDLVSVTELSLGVTLNGSILSGEKQYYLVTIDQAGEYTVSLTQMSTDNDWELYAYESDCAGDYTVSTGIARSMLVGTVDDIGSEYLDPGPYLVVVTEFENADPPIQSSFALNIQSGEETESPVEPPDCYNPLSVTPIDLDNTPTGSIGTVTDTIAPSGVNAYSFFGGEAFTISLTDQTSDCDWRLYTYISDCLDDYSYEEPLASSSENGTADDIADVELDLGEYLIRVDEWNKSESASYTLELYQEIGAPPSAGFKKPGKRVGK